MLHFVDSRISGFWDCGWFLVLFVFCTIWNWYLSNRPLGLCLSPFPLRHKCQYIPRFPNGECEADTAHAEFTKGIKETLPHNSWPLSSVQSLSHVQLFVAPWTVARRASLSITNSWSLLKLIHRVSDAIQPSHPLLSPSLPAFSLSQHQGLFKWLSSSPGS